MVVNLGHNSRGKSLYGTALAVDIGSPLSRKLALYPALVECYRCPRRST